MTDQPPLVRQANTLAKSAQLMDLNEKRLLLLAISRIKWTDDDFLTIDIPITDLAQYIGGNPYQEGKKASDGLLQRVVHVMGEDGAYTKFQWTTLSRFIPASQHPQGVATIRFRFNQELKPFLLQLREHYNSIPLAQLIPIPSFNSQRLYEVLWHDSFAGKRTVLTYPIDDLKVVIGLRDKDGKWEKYGPYKDFKKVITRAQEDFEEYGALRIVSFKGTAKNSRSYTHITLSIRVETTFALPIPTSTPKGDPEVQELARRLTEAGYRQNPLEAIDAYGKELVEKTLKVALKAIREAATSKNPIERPGGFIHNMLKKRVAEHLEEQSTALSNADIDQLARTLLSRYAEAQRQCALTIWQGMSDDEKEDIHNMMRVTVSPHVLKLIDRDGWQGNAYETARNVYLVETYSDTLPEQLTSFPRYELHEGLLAHLGSDDQVRVRERAQALSDNPAS